jgi:two-component system sensor histidine kinase DctS
MGLGLSLCRTVIEQHGGALDFVNLGAGGSAGAGSGTEFRFTLPAEARERAATAAPLAADTPDRATELPR